MVLETGFVSLTRAGEELCGDHVAVRRCDGSVVLVLADGLGSGVKASILSTLTSQILAELTNGGLPFDEAVRTLAQTLPVCSERGIAYSTFTVVDAAPGGGAFMAQVGNPGARQQGGGGGAGDTEDGTGGGGKEISVSRLRLSLNDALVLCSDGVVHAGAGTAYITGW